MPYADVGDIKIHGHADNPAEVQVLTISWVADASGDAVLNGVAVEGILERLYTVKTRDRVALATHSVELFDPLESDVLRGLTTSVRDDVVKTTHIAEQITPGRSLPVHAVGRHTLRISGATASDAGTEKLYVRRPYTFQRWVN